MLLLKVTKVTTGHQKLPKMGQNSIISCFFARRAKKASAEGRIPPQELEVGQHSGPYLLVIIITVPVPKELSVLLTEFITHWAELTTHFKN